MSDKQEFTITKVDTDRQLVFGWANVSIRKDGEVIEDYQKDVIEPDDLEMAAYNFNLDYRSTGEMHRGGIVGKMIESFVSTPEKIEKMGLAPDALPTGWWVGFYIEDESAFAKVKDGTYKMFSIQGKAVREEV